MQTGPTPCQRFSSISPVLSSPSPYLPDMPLDQSMPQTFFSMKFPILVVGAGGLGCQIIKNLALSGFNEIHVIDLDTIDLTNLNRQFLFRKKDVGRHKAEVAADFVMKRVRGVKVIPYQCKIQDQPRSFYRQFAIIIAGLDNVEARRWLNKLVHELVEFDDDGNIVEGTQRFLIDGGTENFSGQCMVVKPYESCCYECILSALPKVTTYNSCTIASTPRLPEHCIQYIYEIEWPKQFPDRKVDTDSHQDIVWITGKAKQRAQSFGIQGVDEMLTLGVIKNIIPAIASTNALIAAVSTNQAFKIATGSAPAVDNYFFYKGMTSIGSFTYKSARNEDCPVCTKPTIIKISRKDTLGEVLKRIQNGKELGEASVECDEGSLLNPLIEGTRKHLEQTFEQLIDQKDYSAGSPIYISWAFKEGRVQKTIDVRLQD